MISEKCNAENKTEDNGKVDLVGTFNVFPPEVTFKALILGHVLIHINVGFFFPQVLYKLFQMVAGVMEVLVVLAGFYKFLVFLQNEGEQ